MAVDLAHTIDELRTLPIDDGLRVVKVFCDSLPKCNNLGITPHMFSSEKYTGLCRPVVYFGKVLARSNNRYCKIKVSITKKRRSFCFRIGYRYTRYAGNRW